ncbi:TRSE protein, partial [mine drainage metagenome]
CLANAVREALAAPGLTGSEVRSAGYWQTLQTDGLAAFYPFVDEAVLEPGGVLVGLLLQDAAPVFLDRWSHASHSWGIFGATGSGKTFATALTLLRTRWIRPEVGVVLLDPLGEFGGFVRALGGTVLTFGAESEVRLNPLDPISTGGDRAEKAGRVGAILRTLFPSLRDEESAALDAAVSRLYDRGPEIPVFSDLLAEVDRGPATERLEALLEPFRSGSLRSVNGPTSVNVETDIVSVDFRGIPEDHLPFHLAY